MEYTIEHFVHNIPITQSFVIEVKHSIESSKGIYTCYSYCIPYQTVTIITMDYLVMTQLPKFTKYINLGDLISLIGSIDFVLGSVDN